MNKTKPLAPLERHRDHDVIIRQYSGRVHHSYYWCRDCRKWLAWLSQQDTLKAQHLKLIEQVDSADQMAKKNT